jgi:hypothetical protein
MLGLLLTIVFGLGLAIGFGVRHFISVRRRRKARGREHRLSPLRDVVMLAPDSHDNRPSTLRPVPNAPNVVAVQTTRAA